MTTAAMIGKSTSVVPAAFAGGVASPSVGLGATTADAVGSADAERRPASSGWRRRRWRRRRGRDRRAHRERERAGLEWPSSANAFHWTS